MSDHVGVTTQRIYADRATFECGSCRNPWALTGDGTAPIKPPATPCPCGGRWRVRRLSATMPGGGMLDLPPDGPMYIEVVRPSEPPFRA